MNKKISIEDAYKIVFKDITKNNDLFVGKYDASHGTEEFMYGVSIVMNYLAYNAREENFEDTFVENMIKSKEKGE